MRPPEIYLSTSAPLYRAFVRRAEPPSARLITQRSQVRILPPLLSKRPSDIGPGAVCTAGVADSDQPGLAEYSMPRWSLSLSLSNHVSPLRVGRHRTAAVGF